MYYTTENLFCQQVNYGHVNSKIFKNSLTLLLLYDIVDSVRNIQ